jgi:hypothetical protein
VSPRRSLEHRHTQSSVVDACDEHHDAVSSVVSASIAANASSMES